VGCQNSSSRKCLFFKPDLQLFIYERSWQWLPYMCSCEVIVDLFVTPVKSREQIMLIITIESSGVLLWNDAILSYLLQEPSLLLEHQDQWGVVVPASRMYAASIIDSRVYGLLIWGCNSSCALDVSDMTVAIWYGESARREF